MDKTIRKFTDFDELKAEEYRYWQSRPVHERVAAVSELTQEHYALKGKAPEFSTVREVQKLGFEYFWVKVFDAWPWMVAQRHGHPDKKIDGKTFWVNTTQFRYSKYPNRPAVGLDPPVTPKRKLANAKQKSDLARIDRMKDSDIDYSDIPPLDDEFFKKAKQVAWPPTKVPPNKHSPPRKRSKPA